MTLAIVQARIGSHRLPGKVLRKVKNRTLLDHLLTRLSKSELIDEIVVGTPDEVIRDEVESIGFECCVSDREENDVLGRYIDIAEEYGADTVVRITGDCPLIDAGVVDRTILTLEDHDFACNIWPRTFPQGLDTEVFPVETLYRLDKVSTVEEREHVCVHAYTDPQFSIANYSDDEDNSHLIWCVDDWDDFQRVGAILEKWGTLPYKHILRRVKWTTN